MVKRRTTGQRRRDTVASRPSATLRRRTPVPPRLPWSSARCGRGLPRLGVGLERSDDAIADHIGISAMLFGATLLAAAPSLPELATGLTSIRDGDAQLAVSDIGGGHAFLPMLSAGDDRVRAGGAAAGSRQRYHPHRRWHPAAHRAQGRFIFRPTKRVLGMGGDSPGGPSAVRRLGGRCSHLVWRW
ncbi:hypothetical protein [Kineococcus rubinsiae]|uniref:hypothetical protein n=1 Tax=Kineococcus rubinsiae TaxID=2609562 RepID=UPI00358DBE82